MRRTLGTLLALTICSAALAACNSAADAGHADSSISSSGPVTRSVSTAPTTATPTSSAPTKPLAPVMPAAAKQKTSAGAKAFVRYYIELINYSWMSGSGDPLRSGSADSCSVCRELAKTVDRYTERGGWLHGGRWIVQNVFPLPGQSLATPKLLVQVKVSPGNWRTSAHGPVHQVRDSKLTNQLNLGWIDSHWAVTDVVPA